MDFFMIEDPAHHTISTCVSRWGSLEIRIDDRLVADDVLPYLFFRFRRTYHIPLEGRHILSVVVKVPKIKFRSFEFNYVLDGTGIRRSSHSFLFQGSVDDPSAMALFWDVVEYIFWPFFEWRD